MCLGFQCAAARKMRIVKCCIRFFGKNWSPKLDSELQIFCWVPIWLAAEQTRALHFCTSDKGMRNLLRFLCLSYLLSRWANSHKQPCYAACPTASGQPRPPHPSVAKAHALGGAPQALPFRGDSAAR